jgi:Natural resistance-associated macrophage protein
MAVVQMMCAGIGMVTGKGLAGNFKQRYPKWLLLAVATALLVANTIEILLVWWMQHLCCRESNHKISSAMSDFVSDELRYLPWPSGNLEIS